MSFLVMSCCGLGAAILANLQIENLLAIILLLPLAGALVLCLIPSSETKLIRVVALSTTLLTLWLCVCLWANFVPN